MIKYLAEFSYRPTIVAVEVVKETAATAAFIQSGARNDYVRKISTTRGDLALCGTWDEAKAALIEMAERHVEGARYKLQYANDRLGDAIALKKPEGV